ncbi:MAG TPA: MBL fold metallo-hydrolase [Clostridiaceae bacterium]|nr:MBL fold metallo-hydrolase [Clostridiaceae bacterium]
MSKKSFQITEELRCYREGFRSCNVFILTCFDSEVLFDPSLSPASVIQRRPISKLIATHAHYDHVGKVNEWKEEYPDVPFLMHGDDVAVLDDSTLNASIFFGRPSSFVRPDRLLQDGDIVELDGQYYLDVLNTPGHTMGSSCFMINRRDDDRTVPIALISGDTLFDRGWGRTDFATGDETLMRDSLTRLFRILSTMPDDLPVCPGHSAITTAASACRFLAAMGF